MNILLSLTKYHHYPNTAILISVYFAVSVRILTSKLLVLLPHLSFTPNLTTATHYTSIYQILRYIDFSKSKTLARTVVKSPRFSDITPVLKSLHWLKFK